MIFIVFFFLLAHDIISVTFFRGRLTVKPLDITYNIMWYFDESVLYILAVVYTNGGEAGMNNEAQMKICHFFLCLTNCRVPAAAVLVKLKSLGFQTSLSM